MSNNSSESVAERLARINSVRARIEKLAEDHHAALRPVRDALQAVADVPLAERDRWADSVAALADVLKQHGMGDVPAALERSERWDRQFDQGRTGNAIAGQTFCAVLASAITDGSRASGYFDALDAHPNITPENAADETCSVLSKLMYDHTSRVSRRFAGHLKEAAEQLGCTRFGVSECLQRCGIALSPAAAAAVNDWKEFFSGGFYQVDISPKGEALPKQPAADVPLPTATVAQTLADINQASALAVNTVVRTALIDAAEAAANLPVGGEAGKPARDTGVELSKVERALILLTRDPDQSDRSIAAKVPCDPALLSRNPKYRRLRESLSGSIAKGTKSKEGTIEAEAEE